jgi:hypothetical protein
MLKIERITCRPQKSLSMTGKISAVNPQIEGCMIGFIQFSEEYRAATGVGVADRNHFFRG